MTSKRTWIQKASYGMCLGVLLLSLTPPVKSRPKFTTAPQTRYKKNKKYQCYQVDHLNTKKEGACHHVW
ncbi:hypothetical protein HB852_01470 [Listeria grandensis]|uniref:hypothetical protein n=1 Tax=Listeria grandensis TaxID=1494963 RepID=UPI001626E2AB|nr:hypothetical protein [Listeria grandensis]MBC1473287.1 hypothetical protein [Listeria grandensis]